METQARRFTTYFLTCNVLTCDLENYPYDYLIRSLKWLNDLVSYWDSKMTAACKTTPQMPLRNCSDEARRNVSIYVILVKGEYIQLIAYFFPGFC